MKWITAGCFLALFIVPNRAAAGLHYSGETIADLPSQWRGFLTDLRALRNIAVKPTAMVAASPMRRQYEDEARKLRDAAKSRKLSADEQADLGGLLLRLGEVDQALNVLRAAQRDHPQHYAIAANLGTAWHLAGDFRQAAEHLRHAIQLAPGKLQRAEEFHLKIIELRRNPPKESQALDDLFGVRFLDEKGQYRAGVWSAAERKKLSSDAVAIAQRLALWLPNDPRLLWQLAELANAHGDVKIAAEIMESCVGQFAVNSRILREHRQIVRAAVAESAAKPTVAGDAAKTEHTTHAGGIAMKSKRPLAGRRFDLAGLPQIRNEGVNVLPWALLTETTVDRHFRTNFPKYLHELNDRQVSLAGFMQPLGEDLEMGAFMLIEYPTGCWYCEMPEINGIVLVELPEGKNIRYTRSLIRITGKLSLNSSDPENFLYTIKGARYAEAD